MCFWHTPFSNKVQSNAGSATSLLRRSLKTHFIFLNRFLELPIYYLEKDSRHDGSVC